MDASSNVNCSNYVPTRTDQVTVASSSSAPLAPTLNIRQAEAGNGQRAIGDRTDTSSNDEERPIQASYPSLQAATPYKSTDTPADLPPARRALFESIKNGVLEKEQEFIKDKAMHERVTAPGFISELEAVGPDLLRSMLLEQMKTLF